MVNSLEFDLIICGSGLAGLRAAIEAAKKGPNLKIGVVSKVQVMRSHSVSAEGGTAAVLFEDEGDTIESHVYDTVKACIFAWKKNKCKHYSIASNQSYSIIELAKLFRNKIRYLPKRAGERYASALIKMNLNNKIIRLSAKIRLKDYVNNFLNNNR